MLESQGYHYSAKRKGANSYLSNYKALFCIALLCLVIIISCNKEYNNRRLPKKLRIESLEELFPEMETFSNIPHLFPSPTPQRIEDEAKTMPLRGAVFTDIHYFDALSESDLGESFLFFERTSESRSPYYTSLIMEELVKEYRNMGLDFVLVAGDLTALGSQESHQAFAAWLHLLKDAGIEVFVVAGNHDIRNGKAHIFKGEVVIPADWITPMNFRSIYSEFGYEKALLTDTETLSYLSPIPNSDYMVLSIDANSYSNNQKGEHPASRPKMSENHYHFIEEALQAAQERGKRVIVLLHYGILRHYSWLREDDPHLINDNFRLAQLLISYGVRIAFTGHNHKNDIAQSGQEPLFDISTSALGIYPFVYRTIGLDSDGSFIINSRRLSFGKDPEMQEPVKYMRSLPGLRNYRISNDKARAWFAIMNLYAQQGLEIYLSEDFTAMVDKLFHGGLMETFARIIPGDEPPSNWSVKVGRSGDVIESF